MTQHLNRIISDLHLEQWGAGGWLPAYSSRMVPPTPEDAETILILAGDIVTFPSVTYPVISKCISSFFEEMCARFKYVIYIAGNHEYYRGVIGQSFDRIDAHLRATRNVPNLITLNSDRMVFDVPDTDLTYVGTTLWTDFNKSNPMALIAASRYMSDFRGAIKRVDGSSFSAEDSEQIHLTDRPKLFAAIKQAKAAGRKVVMVTHHAVDEQSIHERYRGDMLPNYAFHSDLSAEILDAQPDLCVHGHVHDPFDYMIGQTRVIANPYGYTTEPRRHNPICVVAI